MLIQVFIVLIPVTLMLVAAIVWVFHRALHNGQFDRLEDVSADLLADDDRSDVIVHEPSPPTKPPKL